MCNKSALYVANNVPQDVAVNGTVNFGLPVRRLGQNIHIYGGNVVTKGAGYYLFNATFDFTGTVGTTNITFYDNGVEIPGAFVIVTTEAAATNITIPFMTRNTCGMEHVITAVVTGQPLTDAYVSMVVEKI